MSATLPSILDQFPEHPATCPHCAGGGHVCEDHPTRPWEPMVGPGQGCPCGAAGMPCTACEDCAEGDHEACRHGGGWPHQDTNERCGCHLGGHVAVKRRVTWLSVAQFELLEGWGAQLRQAFRGDVPYLVGSATERADWRDVDVRVILADDEVAELDKLMDRRLLGVALSLWGERATGLPVDAQVQSLAEANVPEHTSRRHPLGITSWRRLCGGGG